MAFHDLASSEFILREERIAKSKLNILFGEHYYTVYWISKDGISYIERLDETRLKLAENLSSLLPKPARGEKAKVAAAELGQERKISVDPLAWKRPDEAGELPPEV